jgi:hypothetical protein
MARKQPRFSAESLLQFYNEMPQEERIRFQRQVIPEWTSDQYWLESFNLLPAERKRDILRVLVSAYEANFAELARNTAEMQFPIAQAAYRVGKSQGRRPKKPETLELGRRACELAAEKPGISLDAAGMDLGASGDRVKGAVKAFCKHTGKPNPFARKGKAGSNSSDASD